MTAQLAPALIFRSWDNNGNPLVGGQLFSYQAGTSIPQATYTDSTQGTPNTNPVILNARGEASVWNDPTLVYKFVLQDSQGNLIWSQDNVDGGSYAVSSNLIPVTSNLYTLGTPTSSFANAYLGPNFAPVLGASGNVGYYKRTTAEQSAGVTPTDYSYPPGNVLRYGADPTGVNDSTAAIQNCIKGCGYSGDTCFIPGGSYTCSADIIVPQGAVFIGNTAPWSVDIAGAGDNVTTVTFSGVTHGFYFQGAAAYRMASKISDLTISGNASSTTVVDFFNCDRPLIQRCIVRACTSRGIWFHTCIMPRMTNCFITGCGSASAGEVEYLNCTTICWDQNYISHGNVACVAGLRIDQCQTGYIIGGAIETTGIPLQIGAANDTTTGCKDIKVMALDLENPNDHFIEVGYGCSGSAVCNTIEIANCSGLPSGSTSLQYAVKLAASVTSCKIRENQWGITGGTPVCFYWLETGTTGVYIESCRALYGTGGGSGIPWVMQNGTQIKWATPLTDFSLLDTVGNASAIPQTGTISGTTADISVNATNAAQGGIFLDLLVNNGSSTTMTALTGGVRDMKLMMMAVNGNTTLTHSTSTANQWNLTAATNLVMASGKPYNFVHNGTNWAQV